MQPHTAAPIAPTFDITLPPDPAGANSPVILRFDDASTHLFVHRYQQLDQSNWWFDHALDVSGYGFLSLSLLLIVLVLRVLRRPQLLGHLHCRRCNYDLTRLDQPTPAICPECGTSTAAHRPRTGRVTSPRLLVPLGTLVPLLVLAALTFAHFCEPPRPGNTAWPFNNMRRIVPFWPFARLPAPVAMGLKIFVYPLATGASGHAPAPFELARLGGDWPAASPDGASLAWADFDQSNGWTIEAVLADLRTGQTRRVRLGANEDGFPKAQGFTADGKEALFTITSLIKSSPQDPAAASAPITVRLIGVAIEDGAIRQIASAPSTAINNGPGSWLVPQVLATLHPDGRWSVLSRHSNATGSIATVSATAPLTGTVLGPGQGDYNDGLLRFDSATTVRTDKLSINITSGQVTSLPDAQVAWSVLSNGARASGPLMRGTVPTGVALDLSASSGTIDFSQIVVSPDTRWAAAQIFVPVTGKITTSGVRVWNTSHMASTTTLPAAPTIPSPP